MVPELLLEVRDYSRAVRQFDELYKSLINIPERPSLSDAAKRGITIYWKRIRRSAKLREFSDTIHSTVIPRFHAAFGATTGRPAKAPNDHLIVTHAFPKTLNERVRMTTKLSYYHANATMFLKMVEEYSERLAGGDFRSTAIIPELLMDSLSLLNQWEGSMPSGNPARVFVYRNDMSHMLGFLHSANRLMNGDSGLTGGPAQEAESAVPLLRVALEVRLRNAFGIHGIQVGPKRIQVVGLSAILDALDRVYRQAPSDINLALPVQSIKRIYQWTNPTLHSGVRSYTWMPLFAIRYLWQLLTGRDVQLPNGAVSVNAGIRAKPAAIAAVRAQLGNVYGQSLQHCHFVTM